MALQPARPLNLARVDGADLFTAAEAVVKAALESELAVGAIAGARRGPLAGAFDLAADERVATLFVEHQLETIAVPDAPRALELGLQAARSRRRAIAIVGNDELDAAMPGLERIAATALPTDSGLCLLLEDAPLRSPTACPRRAMQRLDLPCLEAADVDGLRNGIEDAIRLSRAAERAVGLVAHVSILRTIDTLEARPNRVVGTLDVAEAMRHRRRRPRPGETLDLLRMARRLEVNTPENMPSPGETAALGFIAVGAASVAVRHVLAELRLAGRVPVLHLGMVHPLDEAVVERVLARCAQVLVLEPRPGSVGVSVAALAERLRRRDAACGVLWWDAVPAPTGGDGEPFEAEDALRPSLLVRRTLHLLHGVRPGLNVASRLASVEDGAALVMAPPPREAITRGIDGERVVRELLDEVDRWARHRDEEGDVDAEPGALAIDGIEPIEHPARLVTVECWRRRRFVAEGAAAVRQAAREQRSRLLVVIDEGGDDDVDPERLARAAAPGERGERIHIESIALNDRVALRDRLRAAVEHDGATVLVVRSDGGREAEAAAAEIDRLGFQPTQRLVWPAELACDIRPSLPRSLAEAGGARSLVPFDHQLRVERVGSRHGGRPRLELRPLLERIDVIRTKPPTVGWRGDPASRLAPPRPEHGQRGWWRAHLAGVRGRAPGIAAEVLVDAGRAMGYHVRCIGDPTSLGPGRRAWSQVLFTRPRSDEPSPALVASIPYGEADLLLGIDPLETLRALGPDAALRVAASDRTMAAVNDGLLDDQRDVAVDGGLERHARTLAEVLSRTAMEGRTAVDDVAGACREAFLTDRVVDLVLLGISFQRGFVPLSVEAMEGAVRRAEGRGVGRAFEAFTFGRQLGADGRIAAPRRGDERDEPIERLVRRVGLDLERQRPRRRSASASFMALLADSLARTPGLAESEAGRAAQRDLVLAMRRCFAWGGVEYAGKYTELVLGVYASDRGDLGRELTRLAVVPLADAMLMRDFVYMAAMASSLDHRRRTRQRLAVRSARGDSVSRRYLNRAEAVGFGWRLRIDFRTSDWPARALSVLGRAVPVAWRGSEADREVRTYVIDLIRRATEGAKTAYRPWAATLQALHEQAESNRLRGITVDQLRERVEGAGA